MKIRFPALPLLCALSMPLSALAQSTPNSADTRPTLEELEQRIRVLERRLENSGDDAKAVAATAPQVKASPTGLSIASTDGSTVIRFRGTLNVDERTFYSDFLPNGSVTPTGSNTFLLRQARPYIEGALGKLVDFRFMPDFGQGKAIIQDAYVTVKFQPILALTVGKFKSPFGLEFLQADGDIRFPERALPSKLVPQRDVGLQFSGDLAGGRLSYQLAYLNGAADGAASDSNTSPDVDNNDAKDVLARIFAVPFRTSDYAALRGLGFGIAGSRSSANGQVDATGAATNSLLPGYKTNGQQTFFTYRGGTTPTLAWGEHVRIAPQAYYYFRSFGLLAEYVIDRQDVRRVVSTTVTRTGQLTHTSWQAAFNWFLTGEDEGYRFPAPRRPYAIGAPGWGALEFNARIAVLNIDDDAFAGGANSFANSVGSASKATASTVGLTWALTQNVKFLLDYEFTQFTGGAVNGTDAPTEKVLFSRASLNF